MACVAFLAILPAAFGVFAAGEAAMLESGWWSYLLQLVAEVLLTAHLRELGPVGAVASQHVQAAPPGDGEQAGIRSGTPSTGHRCSAFTTAS